MSSRRFPWRSNASLYSWRNTLNRDSRRAYHRRRGRRIMKWVTREDAKVDRIACPWLIRRFVDPGAEFMFVPTTEVMEVAEREEAIPFDVKGAALGHVDGRCSFESIM